MEAFNSLAGNPLRTREDVAATMATLFAPLRRCFSPGRARVRIDAWGACFDPAAAELEGFARPLWGLAAAARGGIGQDCWPLYRAGIASGVDPAHPEYWGEAGPIDQRLVDLAALAFALRIAPEHLWEPLDARTAGLLRAYLIAARRQPFSNNNWKFFRLMIDLGLEAIGVPIEPAEHDRMIAEIDSFFIGDGWYRDGPTCQSDHYIGFAFHYYGLLYAALASGRDAARRRFVERAQAFAPRFEHWFADDGAALPFGRSLTYRFAAAGFWGALAFAGVEALPWGVIKGYYLRHLRWWARQPMMRGDGLLSLGYAYPNPCIVEDYSSSMSPYWAFKAFLPLALAPDHPFWMAEEAMPMRSEQPILLAGPGMLVRHEPDNTTALSSGQANMAIRFGAEKYAKFAYSTRHGFSIESDLRAVERATLDSMLGLVGEDGDLRVRERCETVEATAAVLRSTWRPWPDVLVETCLWWEGDWQMRTHRIESGRTLRSIEGGFAIARSHQQAIVPEPSFVGCAVENGEDFTGILTGIDAGREARLLVCQPNTHLLHPNSVVPQLLGIVPKGRILLWCAVLASPDLARARRCWEHPPLSPRPADIPQRP